MDSAWFVAAAPVALVLLVKPFYALFFVAFGLLQLRAGPPSARLAALRSLGVTAALDQAIARLLHNAVVDQGGLPTLEAIR